MSTNYPVNPRVRAYGKARLDIAGRARTADDWQRLWVQPTLDFPFAWGPTWKHCVEYKVDDFAAEVGFFTDVLCLPVYALDPQYAMFTSPQGDFYFAVVPTHPEISSTPPDALRLQFMVADVHATARALEQRGITFDQLPEPIQPDSSLSIGSFRTPHGISIDLWGVVEPDSSADKVSSLDQDDDNDEHEEEMPDDDEELIPDDEEQEDDDLVEDGEELMDEEEMVEEEDLVEDEEDQGDEFIDDEEEDEDLIFDEGEGEGELDEDDEDYLFDEDDDFKDDED